MENLSAIHMPIQGPYLRLVGLFIFHFLLPETFHLGDTGRHASAGLDVLLLSIQPKPI